MDGHRVKTGPKQAHTGRQNRTQGTEPPVGQDDTHNEAAECPNQPLRAKARTDGKSIRERRAIDNPGTPENQVFAQKTRESVI